MCPTSVWSKRTFQSLWCNIVECITKRPMQPCDCWSLWVWCREHCAWKMQWKPIWIISPTKCSSISIRRRRAIICRNCCASKKWSNGIGRRFIFWTVFWRSYEMPRVSRNSKKIWRESWKRWVCPVCPMCSVRRNDLSSLYFYFEERWVDAKNPQQTKENGDRSGDDG